MASSYEYIVVGSGAGGGTVAARLAESGKRVLVLEAGGDPLLMEGGDTHMPDVNTLPADYRVPVFHAKSSENTAMRWDYFVRHYSDEDQQKRDSKFVGEYEGQYRGGILYPRAGCLGGCTAHNAMICVYPHNSDWDGVAELTGDSSWRADNMRRYFQKLENCRHRPWLRWLSKLGINPSRHGFKGWLSTEAALPLEAVKADKSLIAVILDSVVDSFKKLGDFLERVVWNIQGLADPNDWRLVKDNSFGVRYPPLATHNHERMGTRERLVDVAKRCPDKLTIELNAVVTKVLFDEDNRAVGVEYLKGERLYRAHSTPQGEGGELLTASAEKEVILAGGAFNTPQLLMLSGIGPKEELERHGIAVRVDSPGVGSNLQDRYEVGVVNRMNFPTWKVLEGARYSTDDPQYREWEMERKGVYTTNGAVVAVIKRSLKSRPLPDLFCFALLAPFSGYYPGYAKDISEKHNYLTWAILKAHTNNRAGFVRLKSADPLDTPEINFKYFNEGSDASGEDLQSVVEGVKFIRDITKDLIEDKLIAEEELPGQTVQSDEEIAQFVKDNAWGHHASCTCPIGRADDDMAVLTSDFKVKGVSGLRVVDASVFPRIPGFFIVSSVYIIGEKAADVILSGG